MLSPWLPAMVSLCWLLGAGRCPGRWTAIDAGAGTLLDANRGCPGAHGDRCRRWDCRTPKAGGPAKNATPHPTSPSPARLSGGASPGRRPRRGFLGPKLARALRCAPHNARSHDESARASLRQRDVRNGRNTSPYLDEIPIRVAAAETTGSPPCRPPPSRAGRNYERRRYASKMSISGRSRRTRRWPSCAFGDASRIRTVSSRSTIEPRTSRSICGRSGRSGRCSMINYAFEMKKMRGPSTTSSTTRPNF